MCSLTSNKCTSQTTKYSRQQYIYAQTNNKNRIQIEENVIDWEPETQHSTHNEWISNHQHPDQNWKVIIRIYQSFCIRLSEIHKSFWLWQCQCISYDIWCGSIWSRIHCSCLWLDYYCYYFLLYWEFVWNLRPSNNQPNAILDCLLVFHGLLLFPFILFYQLNAGRTEAQ